MRKMKNWISVMAAVVAGAWCLLAAPAGAGEGGGMAGSGKKGILLVAFGTSVPEARVALDAIGAAAKKRFPTTEIRWAYTSAVIRRKLASAGETLDSPAVALARLRQDGFTHVAVQSLHIAAGSEYHDLAQTVALFRAGPDAFQRLELGQPLLFRRADLDRVVAGVLAALPPHQPGDAIVLMGHGNARGDGDLTFLATAASFQKAAPLAFLGTVEGQPTFEDVLAQCRRHRPKRALLVPFMLVAGDHARNDLAGPEADSWKSQLEQLGVKCIPVFAGLGENEAARNVWLDHLGEAFAKLEGN
ncbi:MAG: sirohydrochlorin cobaltochelatase [Lentisphaeria bacterium]